MGALAVLDAALICAAYMVSLHWGTPLTERLSRSAFEHLPYLLIFMVVWFAAAIDQRLWSLRWNETLEQYLAAVTKTAANATIFCVVAMALFSEQQLAREVLLWFCILTLVVLLLFRALVRATMWELRRRGRLLRRIVVVGANERTLGLLETISPKRGCGYELVGLLEDDATRCDLLRDFDLTYLGPVKELSRIIESRRVMEVYICLPVRSHYELIEDIAHYCEGSGVTVHLLADLFPLRIATSRLMHIDDIPLLSLSTIPEAHAQLAFKRLFDFVVSSALILILMPILFIPLAILIKLESRGPVFFAQERVGQNQRRFKMLKFRSMVANAEALRAELEDMNEADGPVFKIREDPRITRVGRFIRKYSLDEFPQLFNVWIGQMSLVGPRPPIPAEVEEYTWSQRRRLSVRPGMTGLWQVSGRSDVGFEEWVELDLQYIDNWSLTQDLVILMKTFSAVVRGRGAA